MKLGARNLELKVKLTCKISELDLTSTGVQCGLRAMSSVDAEVAHVSSRVCSQGVSLDGVL